MSAARHVNPDQLRMFMTPREIDAEYEPGDFHPDDSDYQWAKKKREAESPAHWHDGVRTLAGSIRANGVQHPISLGRRYRDGWQYVNDGHHRLAVAREQPDQPVPVSYRS